MLYGLVVGSRPPSLSSSRRLALRTMHCLNLQSVVCCTLLTLCTLSFVSAQLHGDIFRMMAQRSLQQGQQDVQPVMQMGPDRQLHTHHHGQHHPNHHPSVRRQLLRRRPFGRQYGARRHHLQRQMKATYAGDMDDMYFHRADDKVGNNSDNVDVFLGMKIYAGPRLRYLADAAGGLYGSGSGLGIDGAYPGYPSQCMLIRTTRLESGLVGGFIPRCKANGDYDKKQISGSTHYCSDTLGTAIVGSSFPFHVPLDCNDWVDDNGYPKVQTAMPTTGGVTGDGDGATGTGSGGAGTDGGGGGSATGANGYTTFQPTTTTTTVPTTTTTPTTTRTTTTTTTTTMPYKAPTGPTRPAATAAPYQAPAINYGATRPTASVYRAPAVYNGATRPSMAITIRRGRRRRQIAHVNLASPDKHLIY